MSNKQPNIILINCDDLGYGDVACYGSTINSTPVLDRMTAEGLRFTDFYAASSLCSPSRAALMTGSHPVRVGFTHFDNIPVLCPGQRMGLNPSEITMARLLRDAGYATGMVGKWHCGDQREFLPTRHGFDFYFGLPYSNDMGRQVTRDWMPPLPLLEGEEVIQEQPDLTSLTERYVEHAFRFMRQHRERPFFLYFAHMYVHLPLYVPHMFMNASRNGRYGAAVECIDWALSVILDELRQLGLEENTLVVFTSDNGSRGRDGGSNEPLRGRKGETWEGGQRVPCIMRWPGKIAPGQTCSEVAVNYDLLPTFAALAGAELPQDRILDGVDLSPMLLGHADEELREELRARPFFYYWQDQLEAVRQGRWKLHVRKAGEIVHELYDLENDIAEANNLFDIEMDTVDALMRLLEQAREDLGDACNQRRGNNCRPIGEVEHGVPLTQYDPAHPYIMALYDLGDIG